MNVLSLRFEEYTVANLYLNQYLGNMPSDMIISLARIQIVTALRILEPYILKNS